MRKFQHGFSIITAIFFLVVLAFLGVAMVTFSTTQNLSSAKDVMGSRAYHESRSGIDWAAYFIANSASGVAWAGCTAATPAVSLTEVAPFTVSVYCSSVAVSEVGASPTDTIWIYDVSAVACTEAVCPSATPGGNYVERVISVKMGR